MMEAVSNLPGNIRLMTLLSICGWFITSISLSNINKWIFQSYPSFQYPIFLTMLHLLSTLTFCGAFFHFTLMGKSIKQNFDQNPISGRVSGRIVFLSVIFTISIACGNIAIRFLYISFLKMIFAMTPLVTLLFSGVLFRQPVDMLTYVALVPICVGCAICTIGEVNFNLVGFMMAVMATVLRSLRSVLQGFLLKEERIDSFSLLYRMSLPSFFQLFIGTLLFERSVFSDGYLFSTPSIWILIFMSCSCAVGYNIMTFLVTFYTSPVTLPVLGNVSMVLTIAISLILFQNELSAGSLLGIVSVTMGTWMYHKTNQVRHFLVFIRVLQRTEETPVNNHVKE